MTRESVQSETHVSERTLLSALRQFGWEPSPGRPGIYDIWTPTDPSVPDLEIIVPRDGERSDYASLFRRAVDAFTTAEGADARRRLDLLLLVEQSQLDATEWRKETPFGAGFIGWEEGEKLIASASASLSAAARAVREPRRRFGNASHFIAKTFLDHCLMGQTAVGSYIVTAHIPSQHRFHLTQKSQDAAGIRPRETETTSGRAVVESLATALEAVQSGLEEYSRTPHLEVFEERVEAGVSVELTRALADFTAASESAVKITRYAANSDLPGLESEFDFKPTDAGVLEKVARTLAATEEPRRTTLTGEVTLLSHGSDAPAHVIRLLADPGSGANVVRVRLDAKNYEKAIEAHRQGAKIRVSGTLERDGKSNWLYNTGHVVIEEQQASAPPAEQLKISED